MALAWPGIPSVALRIKNDADDESDPATPMAPVGPVGPVAMVTTDTPTAAGAGVGAPGAGGDGLGEAAGGEILMGVGTLPPTPPVTGANPSAAWRTADQSKY